MTTLLNDKSLNQLKQFVNFIKSNTDVLHSPELSFFKDFLVSLNATIPPKKHDHPDIEDVDDVPTHAPEPKKPRVSEEVPKHEKHDEKHEKHDEKHEKHEEKPEPVPEEPEVNDDPDLLPPDENYESIEMGDPNKEVSEDDDSDSYSLLAEGRKAARDNNHEQAIVELTGAIKLNPKSSVLFATRAESFLHLKRPNAAIKDCNRALELNPDSGKALKTRGKARRFLGKYAEANYDLNQGNLLDWDESTDKMIKEIKERADKAIQIQRKEDEKKKVGTIETGSCRKTQKTTRRGR
jgi:suppressor of tumorigenicity protein 13